LAIAALSLVSLTFSVPSVCSSTPRSDSRENDADAVLLSR
jgi:hypothetical protein